MINLEITTLVVGPLLTNCYLVVDKKTKQGFILDPGDEPEKILSTLTPEKGRGPLGALRPTPYTLTAILATHCHFDHLGAAAQLKDKLKIPFLIPQGEEKVLAASPATAKIWTGQKITPPPQPDGRLKDGDKITAGMIAFRVLSTPGHSPAGVSLYSQDESLLFPGDTLFSGSIGRIDLPGGSGAEMRESLKKLIKLPNETLVLPGHGEKTTVGREKVHNPFLRDL